MPGERELIDWIAAQQRPSPGVRTGIGDDLAVLKWPGDDLLLVGVDQVLDTVHFDSTVHSPYRIGRKGMNRNLSDCAAMGCLPAAAVVAVALPGNWSLEQARELYNGLREAGDEFDCPIVGGDTATWPGKLALTVTILGRSAGLTPVTRAGAKPGDSIFVTGPLGGSILGRHMDFHPRVGEGRRVAPIASAMIDVSDGLSRDLDHICQASGVGAVLRAGDIPIHADAHELSRRDGVSPLEHALHDGEDYELLFTSAKSAPPPLGITIGEIIAEPGLWLLNPDGQRRPIPPRGWEHSFGAH